MQQRSIPQMVIDWLLDYGLTQDQGDARILYFNKKSKKLIRQYAGSEAMSIFQKYEKVYAVVSSNDDSIITAGWKNRKFRRV